ncbi:MAG: sulfatase [Phycisphaerales bacterium]|nr:MAG: sulfatase [Phycisphaerales bacterium]
MERNGGAHRLMTGSLAGIAAGLALLPACRPAEEPGPPPQFDVVLISVDTLRADRLNCYGYEKREVSPNIDALAGDGILFENFITSSPWTTPAHLTMFTSLYPSTHGVTQTIKELEASLQHGAKFSRLADSRVTLAEVLKASGYTTGAFTGGGTLAPGIGFDQGFDHYVCTMHKLHSFNMREMNEWIDRHAERLFFLFWHNFEVHAPYLDGTYLDEVLPPDTAAEIRQFLHEASRTRKYRGPTVEEQKNVVERTKYLLLSKQAYNAMVCGALYDGGIKSMDNWLGEFIRDLRRRGLYDRTLIILTSDHGEEFGERNPHFVYGAHGHSLYEEMVRAPLIIKLPDQRYAGTRVSSAVRMIDVMPTILDVLGIKRGPKEMQGLSLRPLWERPETREDRLAVNEALANESEKKAARTGRYKFIYSLDAGAVARHGRSHMPEHLDDVELYDLHADPEEKNNLLRDGPSVASTEIAATLEKHLREYVAGARGRADTVELDEEAIENLRALGYLD